MHTLAIEKKYIYNPSHSFYIAMVEYSKKEGIVNRIAHRKERRIQSAIDLAASRPVGALRDILIRHGIQDAVCTVTEPKRHPFARISVEITWDINRHLTGILTEDHGHSFIEGWNGRQIKIFWADTDKKRHAGFMINTNDGDTFVPVEADATRLVAVANAAIKNPLRFQGSIKPGTERHRKIVN